MEGGEAPSQKETVGIPLAVKNWDKDTFSAPSSRPQSKKMEAVVGMPVTGRFSC